MVQRPELEIASGALAGKRFAVPPGGLRLGRSSSNDICIPDEELSRNRGGEERPPDEPEEVRRERQERAKDERNRPLLAPPVRQRDVRHLPGDGRKISGEARRRERPRRHRHQGEYVHAVHLVPSTRGKYTPSAERLSMPVPCRAPISLF